MTTRRATCSCGQLEIVCEGEPIRISICHCLACQKRTGSVFGAQARFPRARVTSITGKESIYARGSDSGSTLTHHFCPLCAATVYYENTAVPDTFGVPIGAFADPSFPAPKVSVYEARRHPWTLMPSLEVEHHD